MSIEAKIRKYQDIAKCGAWAVICLSLWSTVRYFVYMGMGDEFFYSVFGITEKGELVKPLMYFFITVLSIIEVLFKCYLGRKAIKIVKNNEKHYVFVALCIIYIVFDILSYYLYFIDDITLDMISDLIINLFIEITTCIAVIDMMISCCVVRKLKKQIRSGEGM